ncbi:MAG TPA: hypothetical protein VGN90_17715 [Pyrinomonadaceae bacterium]|jgi:photosystem II stability/assembly factor-like uncharacterized protein|nr:hypothetical protein [Pyrinomonadaceae bacterium]
MNLLLFLATISIFAAPQWTLLNSGVTARLRGVSAASDRIAWASGADSTVLRTTDGGTTWKKLTVTSDVLDFRDIDAIDDRTAYVLSIGNGPASRIYKTTDAGATWTLQFKNDDPKAFYDAMSFWDRNHGIVIGDSIDGQFCIMTTDNGGRSWVRVPASALPPALENEGAFAASGTNIALFGKSHAWIGLGAGAKARVLRTVDRGHTWQIAETPLVAGASAGIFSVAFRDAKHGVVVGGDYRKENEAVDNLALTSDGGITWTLVKGVGVKGIGAKGLTGFRSVVAYVPRVSGGSPETLAGALVAVGPSGANYSTDDGSTWMPLAGPGFDTLSFAPGRAIAFATGARGSIGKLFFGMR